MGNCSTLSPPPPSPPEHQLGPVTAIRARPERHLLGNCQQPKPPLGCRNPLCRSVRDGESHSGPHATTRSPAPGFSKCRGGGEGVGGGA